MGLLELSASFTYMNFAFLKRRNHGDSKMDRDFPPGEKTGFMHVVAQGGENG